jgi:hypothetical protein
MGTESSTTNPDKLFIHSTVEALINAARDEDISRSMEEDRKKNELTARKRETQKAEEDAVGARYAECTFSHVKTLALVSNERAEVIVQATLGSCSAESQAVDDIHRRYDEGLWGDEAMAVFQRMITQHLLLEVIKARAQAPPPPSGPPVGQAPPHQPAPEQPPKETPL